MRHRSLKCDCDAWLSFNSGRRPLDDELVRRHVVIVSTVATPMPRNDTLSVGTVLVAGRRSALSVKASHILVVAVPKLAGS